MTGSTSTSSCSNSGSNVSEGKHQCQSLTVESHHSSSNGSHSSLEKATASVNSASASSCSHHDHHDNDPNNNKSIKVEWTEFDANLKQVESTTASGSATVTASGSATVTASGSAKQGAHLSPSQSIPTTSGQPKAATLMSKTQSVPTSPVPVTVQSPVTKRSIPPPPSLPPTAVTASAKQRRASLPTTTTTAKTTMDREFQMRKSFLHSSQNANTNAPLSPGSPASSNAMAPSRKVYNSPKSTTKDEEKFLRKQLWQETQLGSSMQVQVSDRMMTKNKNKHGTDTDTMATATISVPPTVTIPASRRKSLPILQVKVEAPFISAPPTSGTRSPPKSPVPAPYAKNTNTGLPSMQQTATTVKKKAPPTPTPSMSSSTKEQETQLRKEMLQVAAKTKTNCPRTNKPSPPPKLPPRNKSFDNHNPYNTTTTAKQPPSPSKKMPPAPTATGTLSAKEQQRQIRQEMVQAMTSSQRNIMPGRNKRPASKLPPRNNSYDKHQDQAGKEPVSKPSPRTSPAKAIRPAPSPSKNKTLDQSYSMSAKEQEKQLRKEMLQAATTSQRKIQATTTTNYAAKPPSPLKKDLNPSNMSAKEQEKQLRKEMLQASAASQRNIASTKPPPSPAKATRSPGKPRSAKEEERQLRKEMLQASSQRSLSLSNRKLPTLSTSSDAASITMPSSVLNKKKAPPSSSTTMDLSAKSQERQLRKDMLLASQRNMQVSDRKLAPVAAAARSLSASDTVPGKPSSGGLSTKEQERQLRKEMIEMSQRSLQVSDRKLAPATAAASSPVTKRESRDMSAKDQERKLRREMLQAGTSDRKLAPSVAASGPPPLASYATMEQQNPPPASSAFSAKQQERQLRKEMVHASQRSIEVSDRKLEASAVSKDNAKEQERQLRKEMVAASQRDLQVSDRKLSARRLSGNETPPRSPMASTRRRASSIEVSCASTRHMEGQFRRDFLQAQSASERNVHGGSPSQIKKKRKKNKRRSSRRQLGDFLEQQEVVSSGRAATVTGFAASASSVISSDADTSVGPASVAQTVADPNLLTAKERERQFRKDFLQASQRSMQVDAAEKGRSSSPPRTSGAQTAKDRERQFRKDFIQASERSMQVDDGESGAVAALPNDETGMSAKERERQYRKQYIQASQRSLIEHEIDQAVEVAKLRKKKRKKKKKKKRSSQLANFLERNGDGEDLHSTFEHSVVSSALEDRASYTPPVRGSHTVAGEVDIKERERQYRKTFLEASQRSLQDVGDDGPRRSAVKRGGSRRGSSRSLADFLEGGEAKKTVFSHDARSADSYAMSKESNATSADSTKVSRDVPPGTPSQSTAEAAMQSAKDVERKFRKDFLQASSRSLQGNGDADLSSRNIAVSSSGSNLAECTRKREEAAGTDHVVASSQGGVDDSSFGNYSAREWSSRRLSSAAKFGFTSARERMKEWMAATTDNAAQDVHDSIIPATVSCLDRKQNDQSDIERQEETASPRQGGPPIDMLALREARENEKMGMSRGRSYSKIPSNVMRKMSESDRSLCSALQAPSSFGNTEDQTRRQALSTSEAAESIFESEADLNNSAPSLSASDAAALREARENEKMGMARGRSYKRIANEVMERMNESERSLNTSATSAVGNAAQCSVVVQRQLLPGPSSREISDKTEITSNVQRPPIASAETDPPKGQPQPEDIELGMMDESQISVDITVCRPESRVGPSALDANPNLAMRRMFDDIETESDQSETDSSGYCRSDGAREDTSEGSSYDSGSASETSGSYDSDSSGSYDTDSSDDDDGDLQERKRIIRMVTGPSQTGLVHGSAAPSPVVTTKMFPRAAENVAQPAEPVDSSSKKNGDNPADVMYEDQQPLALVPGAYSRTPGALVRNPTISFSLVGVVEDSPAQPLPSLEDEDCLSVIDEGEQSDGTASLGGSAESFVMDNDGLVEAVPIDEDAFDDGVVEAAPLDLAAKQAKEEVQQKRTKRCKVIAVIVLIVSAVIIAVSVVFGKKKRDDVTIEIITNPPAPTTAPTEAPTSAPTISLDFLNVPIETQDAINDPTTPQRKAIEWIHEDILLADPEYSEERKLQRFALATIYFANGGTDWEGYGTWLNHSLHECNWFHRGNDPMCGDEGEVLKELVLYGSGLTGTVPPEIALLTGLAGLDMQSNSLSGSIPTHLNKLSSLESLQLGDNGFTGQVPIEIYGMSNLRNLGLQANSLSGSLPTTELGQLTNLAQFWISNNEMITGQLPTEIGLLTKLSKLGLNNNGLNGTIASELGVLSALEELWLGKNRLTGQLPSEVGLLSNLVNMTLDSNGLSQRLPTEIGRLSNLGRLRLFDNKFSGPIPSEIGLMRSLIVLSLSTNELSNAIPSELWQLTRLEEIGLDLNYLSGNIPPAIGNFSNLVSLSLHTNYLTGSLPTEVGIPPQLNELLLGANLLNGTLPTELGLLKNLFSVDLAECFFTGSIPEQLTSPVPLKRLWLLMNSLTGTIPTALSALPSLEELNLDSNFLSRSVPSELGLLSNSLKSLTFGQNDFTGQLPTQVGQLSKLETLAFYDTLLSGSLPSQIAFLGKSLTSLSGYQAGLLGTLPVEFGALSKVQQILLSKNSLTGPIPHSWLEMTQLVRLHIGDNALSGSLLPEIGFNLTKLEYLHLGGNSFTGSIPVEVALGLTNLNTLWLSNNALTGSLPTEMGLGLQNLTTLVLSGNQLGYALPTELGELSLLKNLVLNQNSFEDRLPSELGLLQELEVFQAYVNELSGAIPSELGTASSLKDLVLSYNGFTGTVPTELANLVSLTRFHLNENSGLAGTVPAGVCDLQWEELTVDCETLQCTCGCTCG